jgi:hypothetical protein
VRPLVVVGVYPAVDPVLGCLERLERRDVVKELGPQALMEPLDLPRGRGRPRLAVSLPNSTYPLRNFLVTTKTD